MLMDRGFRRVRPLEGGLDGWVESGFLVEAFDTIERNIGQA